jgi:hypothetical protein
VRCGSAGLGFESCSAVMLTIRFQHLRKNHLAALALLSVLPDAGKLRLAAQLAYWRQNGSEVEMPGTGFGDAKTGAS